MRVNPDIDPKTHPYISTGLSENKFGISIDEAKCLYLYAHKSQYLEPVAIHFHIGSQILSLEPLAQAVQKNAELLRSLLAIGLPLRFFDVGGGIGIPYNNEQTFALYDYAQMILSALNGLDVTIICEPGRFIVGNSGFFICSVLYEKITPNKHFVIVDGAMNDLIRPTLYQAYHEVALWRGGWVQDSSGNACDIVGPICESGDWLAKDVVLPAVQSGDLVVVKSAGAYGMAMSSNYNTRPKAAEVAFEHTGKVWQIRERESLKDLWAAELGFLNLRCKKHNRHDVQLLQNLPSQQQNRKQHPSKTSFDFFVQKLGTHKDLFGDFKTLVWKKSRHMVEVLPIRIAKFTHQKSFFVQSCVGRYNKTQPHQ